MVSSSWFMRLGLEVRPLLIVQFSLILQAWLQESIGALSFKPADVQAPSLDTRQQEARAYHFICLSICFLTFFSIIFGKRRKNRFFNFKENMSEIERHVLKLKKNKKNSFEALGFLFSSFFYLYFLFSRCNDLDSFFYWERVAGLLAFRIL